MNIEFYTKKYNSEYISSRSNRKVVFYSKLSTKKYRDEEKLFLAEGIKLTLEALKFATVERVLVCAENLNKDNGIIEILDSAYQLGIEIVMLSAEAFCKVSTEQAPQGVIAVVRYGENIVSSDFGSWQEGKRLLMLDGIRDPGNLGTILRSAEALGVSGVVLHDCADVYNNKTVRAGMGTVYRLSIFVTNDGAQCVRNMKSLRRRVLGAALGEHNLVLGNYSTSTTDCVIIGNEGHGISQEILQECDATVRIPMTGLTESLNAAQAASCILWEYQRTHIQ